MPSFVGFVSSVMQPGGSDIIHQFKRLQANKISQHLSLFLFFQFNSFKRLTGMILLGNFNLTEDRVSKNIEYIINKK